MVRSRGETAGRVRNVGHDLEHEKCSLERDLYREKRVGVGRGRLF